MEKEQYPTYLHERELGGLISQVEYLRDALKLVQIDISNAVLQRKDLSHALQDVTKSFENLEIHLKEMDADINRLGQKIRDHISNDKSFEEIFSTKLGKIVIGIGVTLGGFVVLEICKYIKRIILQ